MIKHIKNKHNPATQSVGTSTRLTPCNTQGLSSFNLTTINTNTFRGDGQRISETEGSQTINYILQKWCSTLHYRGGGNPLSLVTQDIRQSTSTVLDANFDFLTGFRYTDFGITTRLADTYELIEIAYTGGIWDESTGLYYLNARFYNPVDARFMQIDVARNGGDLRATLSLYGYCEGDPINKVDPTGYWSKRAHVDLTRRIARNLGFRDNLARLMGSGSRDADIFVPFGGYHFNTARGGGQLRITNRNPWPNASFREGRPDSRRRAFDRHQRNAVRYWNQGFLNVAVYEFGFGLHAMQDIHAHGNIRPIHHQLPRATARFWDNQNRKAWRWRETERLTRRLIQDFARQTITNSRR